MNKVNFIGRLTREPEINYKKKEDKNICIAKFSIAINRFKDAGVDYLNIAAFGKQAELVEKYLHTGDRVGITGRAQTGHYEKDGRKIFSTSFIMEELYFLENKKSDEGSNNIRGFEDIANNDDLPFN